MHSAQILLASVLPLSAVAALIDLETGHIPNRLVGWGLCGGALLHVALAVALPPVLGVTLGGRLLVGVLGALAGLLCAALVPYVLFRIGAMGGGDVKLLAALGATLGPVLALQLQLLAFALAALFVPAVLAYRGELGMRIGHTLGSWLERLRVRRQRPRPPLPARGFAFGPAVFAASLVLAGTHFWSW